MCKWLFTELTSYKKTYKNSCCYSFSCFLLFIVMVNTSPICAQQIDLHKNASKFTSQKKSPFHNVPKPPKPVTLFTTTEALDTHQNQIAPELAVGQHINHIEVYKIQNLNFGNFTARGDSQITVTPNGTINHLGSAHSFGYDYQQAIFEIIVQKQTTLSMQIEVEQAPIGINTTTKMNLELLSNHENTFFQVYPPPLKNYIHIGGTLKILESTADNDGNYNGSFNIWFTDVNE